MIHQVQLYDDKLGFFENKIKGPFGRYANIKTPYKNLDKPKYDFFGVPIYSPFGIGAGPLPSSKFIQAAYDNGYDIATLKSVRTDTFPLNPFPQILPVDLKEELHNTEDEIVVADSYSNPLAVANSFGIPSLKPKEWEPDMVQALKAPSKGQAILVAFQGTARGKGREDFVQDHVKGIGLVKSTGAKTIEINLSCPNEGEAVLACFDTDITTRIVNAVKDAHPEVNIIIKLAYFEDKNQLRDLIKKIGKSVEGISAINTIPALVLDKDGKEAFPGRPKAGISGAPIKWAGLEMTEALHQAREEFGHSYKIIGLGGVLSARDFHEYQRRGADIVMAVTGPMWNPDLAKEIKASL